MIHKVADTRRNRSGGSRGAAPAGRLDHPHLLLPSPRFEAGKDEPVLRFFDEAATRLENPQASADEIPELLRHVYAVLHLRRRDLDHSQWRTFVKRCRGHRITGLLHQDVLTKRAFEKPRGYAGDAELLDYMYGTEHFWSPPPMSDLGQRLHAWTTLSSACQGVKSRRGIIAELIDRLSCELDRPHVLSLAAGHLREAEISAAIIRQQLGRLVAIDSDPLSLRLVERQYGKYGVETVHASAREVLSGRIDMSEFDLIYSSGLCDYLNDTMSQRLAAELFDRLNPGGTLLLTNFDNDIEGVGYMETFMDWNLVYRDRIGMMKMTARIPNRRIGQITVFTEENDNVLFIAIERSSWG